LRAGLFTAFYGLTTAVGDALISRQLQAAGKKAENVTSETADSLSSDSATKSTAVDSGAVRPEDIEHHHSQMSDQRLFAETLRMLGDVASLGKLIEAYPSISFN